ncbi:hypothetical protein PUMCH_003689 [Australozyma saopauloensis]|uniref:Large ribosomal subunit protein uL23m n=1 Tax=Australozyma saopauloensis TaxID=291208 RepID=A0AAX4HDA5_9ASCO|nr:hypothetical protein PUMCH_003689 [[Candida] saopauloensis]
MNSLGVFRRGPFATFARLAHHKVSSSQYPKVNVNDVVLDKPRFGFRKERAPLLSADVKEIFSQEAIKQKYIDAGKPVPIKYRVDGDKIARRNFDSYQDLVAQGLPHFRVGEKEVYLPKATITLLRPKAKYTPYQASFIVPRNFNKMDLRDYLWHVYGLRALNVTVQLSPATYARRTEDNHRYRRSQVKYMTIDMEEPFVWPEIPEESVLKSIKEREGDTRLQIFNLAVGADKEKPTGAYDGLMDKPRLPDIFVSKANKKLMKLKSSRTIAKEDKQRERDEIAKYLNL